MLHANRAALWHPGSRYQKVSHLSDRAARQVLANLVANAIKFSPEERIVIISAECVHGGVRLVVRDEGSGIAAEKLHEDASASRARSEQEARSSSAFPPRRACDAHASRRAVEPRPMPAAALIAPAASTRPDGAIGVTPQRPMRHSCVVPPNANSP